MKKPALNYEKVKSDLVNGNYVLTEWHEDYGWYKTHKPITGNVIEDIKLLNKNVVSVAVASYNWIHPAMTLRNGEIFHSYTGKKVKTINHIIKAMKVRVK